MCIVKCSGVIRSIFSYYQNSEPNIAQNVDTIAIAKMPNAIPFRIRSTFISEDRTPYRPGWVLPLLWEKGVPFFYAMAMQNRIAAARPAKSTAILTN